MAESRAAWRNATDITPAHEQELAQRSSASMAYLSAVIPLAARFDSVFTDVETRRQLTLLKRATSLPAPLEPAQRDRLATLASQLESRYGRGALAE